MAQPDDLDVLREKYSDLAELERRGEGVWYSARIDDTPVRVLALSQSLRDGVTDVGRFIETLERSAAIHHENIAPLVSWGHEASGMLHCAYARLESRPIRPGSLAGDAVALTGARVARCLKAIHGSGMVHGAISTERISDAGDRGLQLEVFGLFGALCDGGVSAKDAAAALSDPAFVSPEVLAGDRADERSDIYSLGAALYELLTGKPPFGGRTTSYVMATVLSTPDDEQVAQAAASGPVIDAMLRAIEKSPDDRWQSAAAFAAALTSGAAHVTTGEHRAARIGCLPGAAVLSALAIEVFASL